MAHLLTIDNDDEQTAYMRTKKKTRRDEGVGALSFVSVSSSLFFIITLTAFPRRNSAVMTTI